MAMEWASHNIRVNAIAPGSIITARILATPERVKHTREGLIPMKRLGTSDEVGKAVEPLNKSPWGLMSFWGALWRQGK